MFKWQYLTIILDCKQRNDRLEEMGELGWEVAGVTLQENVVGEQEEYYCLKRRYLFRKKEIQVINLFKNKDEG